MSQQYSTPDLPYEYDALEPHIDQETMAIHHDKHHASYTKKLNAAVEKHEELFEKKPADLLQGLNNVPEDIRTAVRNNGGGHVNHALFWSVMGPDGGGEPTGELADAVAKDFGSFDKFKALFEEAAKTQFGSGWAWLAVNADGGLEVTNTLNQDTPLSQGKSPILLLDVWEHAYYLKYQNKRPDYITAWWNIVNWSRVQDNYQQAIL